MWRTVQVSCAMDAPENFGQTVPSSPGHSQRTPSLRSRNEYTPKSVPDGVLAFMARPAPSTPAMSTVPSPTLIVASFLSSPVRSICRAAHPRRNVHLAFPVAFVKTAGSEPVAFFQCSASSCAAVRSTAFASGGRTISSPACAKSDAAAAASKISFFIVCPLRPFRPLCPFPLT